MKDTLKSQLESYLKDNSDGSKEQLYNTINSMTRPIKEHDKLISDAIDKAKQALTDSFGSKDNIIKSVEDIISNLK